MINTLDLQTDSHTGTAVLVSSPPRGRRHPRRLITDSDANTSVTDLTDLITGADPLTAVADEDAARKPFQGYVFHPDFDRADAVSQILYSTDLPPAAVTEAAGSVSKQRPLLTANQVTALFKKMNYLKFLAAKYRNGASLPFHDSIPADDAALDRMASEVRDLIAERSQLVVYKLAHKCSRRPDVFDELVSDGFITLLRVIERFDCARNVPYISFASYIIGRQMRRTSFQLQQTRDRFRTNSRESLASIVTDGTTADSGSVEEIAFIESLISSNLSAREKLIIKQRFPWNSPVEPATRPIIASSLGVSAERVRVLENRALAKLRVLARRVMSSQQN